MSPCGAHPRGRDLSSSHTMILASTVSSCTPRTLKKWLFMVFAFECGDQWDWPGTEMGQVIQGKKIKVCRREGMQHSPVHSSSP